MADSTRKRRWFAFRLRMATHSKRKRRFLCLSILLLSCGFLVCWRAINLNWDRRNSIKLFDAQKIDANGLLPHIKKNEPDYMFKYMVHGGLAPECAIYFVLTSQEGPGLTTLSPRNGRVLMIDKAKAEELDAILCSWQFFNWKSMADEAALDGLNWEITAKTPSGVNRVIVRPDNQLSKKINYLFTQNLRAYRDERDNELTYFRHVLGFDRPSSSTSWTGTTRDSHAAALVTKFFALLQQVELLATK